MTDISLTTEQQADIDKAEAYLNGAKNYVIDNQNSLDRACDMLLQVKSKKKEYDDLRKQLKAPVNLMAKQVEDLFRKPINFLIASDVCPFALASRRRPNRMITIMAPAVSKYTSGASPFAAKRLGKKVARAL